MTQMPVAFFGIGAMRAGTTWLSELLSTYPDCRMMPVKELHFFDVRYGKYPGLQHHRSMAKRLATLSEDMVRRVDSTLEKMQDESQTPKKSAESEPLPSRRQSEPWTDKVRRRFFSNARLDRDLQGIAEITGALSIRDISSYTDYLKRHSVGAKAFGEITPAYGLLSAAAFAEMDGLFPNTRFIFIMRDPVERLWSHIRYKNDRAAHSKRAVKDVNADFLEALQLPNAIGRSEYQRTIEELESVIPKDRILYLFYETMTSPETGPAEIQKVEALLGIERLTADPKFFSKPINASSSAKLDPENEAAAMKLFAPVYAFVERRFGRPPQWRSPAATS